MIQSQLVKRLLALLTFPEVECQTETGDASLKVSLTLNPKDSGILIGRRGETIDALQLILTLIHNHQADSFTPVELDLNHYRSDRQTVLQEMADHAAENALHSGREIILPPLSSRERRLIHLHLHDRRDVSTYSEGEGPNRRLVIRPHLEDTNSPQTNINQT